MRTSQDQSILNMFNTVLKTPSLDVGSEVFEAEISVESRQKLFIFIIYKKYFLDQSIQKIM